MKIGLISNRRSGRHRRDDGAALRSAAEAAGLPHASLHGVEGLPDALRDLAAAGIDLLAISGGDGTVSAVLTEVLEGRVFATPPLVAILPDGTTNMTAADIGLRAGGTAAIARLQGLRGLDEAVAVSTERAVLRLRRSPDDRPICGMFFGAAAIHRAILLCRRRFESSHLPHAMASAATIGYLLGRRLLPGAPSDRILRGDDIEVSLDGGPGDRRTLLLVLVTSLDRLVLGSRPFWGEESGPLRYTAITYPARHLGRNALRVLYGGMPRRLPADCYISHNAETVRLRMDCPYTLDGELFSAGDGADIELGVAGRLRFVKC